MLIDNEDEMPSELEAEEAKIEDQIAVDDSKIPEKYRNKSLEDVIKMHQEVEKLVGRQAQEVGEVRKLADELIKQNLGNQVQHAQVEPEVDFFENPQKAIQNTVERHPDVLAAKQAANDFKKMQVQQMLAQTHPDFQQVTADPEFSNWVKSSNVRLNLFAKADSEYDFDSANELISTFKQLRGIKAKQVTDDAESSRKSNLKAATVDIGGSGESGKRIYRRADLIRLKMNDPDRYEALQSEIMQAYSEGRVK